MDISLLGRQDIPKLKAEADAEKMSQKTNATRAHFS